MTIWIITEFGIPIGVVSTELFAKNYCEQKNKGYVEFDEFIFDYREFNLDEILTLGD